MKQIVIFASGAGSNAQKIIDHFRAGKSVTISLICCNKPGAGVIDIAQNENIPVLMLERERFFTGDAYIDTLKNSGADLIVLAGFLWKIPQLIIDAFPQRIINIHPALLPKYGGKGMYGARVHEAVLAAGERQSGISIHFVDEHFDHGDLIFQAKCSVEPDDTPQTLSRKIHTLEYEHYPKVIAEILER